MLIKGHNIDHIVFGSSFTKDGFSDTRFDYMLANPPFGVEWKPDQKEIQKEHDERGMDVALAPVYLVSTTVSLLFLQHMNLQDETVKDGGSRIGIVFNGSPLFTGDAGSGESEIRRWVIENDWLEAIIALPDQLFYNTGIFTYIWIVTNRKSTQRRGKVQLINGVQFCRKMRKRLNNKRNEISPEFIDELTRIYGDFQDGKARLFVSDGKEEEFVVSKVFDNADFGYRQITVERPLRLNFQVSPERLDRLKESSGFQNLASSKNKDKKAIAADIDARQASARNDPSSAGTLRHFAYLLGQGFISERS